MAGELLAALGYRGVFDLDFRLDRATGAYHLLDFNLRPGPPGPGALPFVRPPVRGRDLTSPRRGPTDGPRGRTETETAWFPADDPAPASAMAGAWLLHVLCKGMVTLRRLPTPGRPCGATPVAPPPTARTASDRMTRRKARCTTW